MHGSLVTWLKAKRARPWQEVAHAVTQGLLALAVLHGERIVHGALTPDNIVLMNVEPGSGAYWHYQVGNRAIYVRKARHVFALNNFSKTVDYGQENVRQQPHCEVGQVLRMFMVPSYDRAILLRLKRLARIATDTRPDAGMFLWDPDVGNILRGNYVGIPQVKRDADALAGNSNAADRFDVLPAGYRPHTGDGDCKTGSRTNGLSGSRGGGGNLRNIASNVRSFFTLGR